MKVHVVSNRKCIRQLADQFVAENLKRLTYICHHSSTLVSLCAVYTSTGIELDYIVQGLLVKLCVIIKGMNSPTITKHSIPLQRAGRAVNLIS